MSDKIFTTDDIPEDFNKNLEEKILRANEDKTLVKWNKLLPELMMSDIFLAGLFQGNNESGGQGSLLIMQHEGKNIIPFFSHPDRMSVLPEEQLSKLNMIRMRAGDFFYSIKGMATILNPSSDYTRVFSGFDTKVLAMEFRQTVSENTDNTDKK
ncbi:MAG: SseB family protein [Oscillospiraceae bacterium]|nr:SseB family protein [Oscillospiraceae bacterium]